MWLTFWRKTVFVNNYPLLQVWSKKNSLKNPNFPQDLPLSNMIRKTNFLSISVILSEIANFMSKKKCSLTISPKMLQKTERHGLEVCGSLCGEKQFLLIFYPYTGLIKNSCLNKSRYSSGFASFKHCKKKTFWVFQCSFLR